MALVVFSFSAPLQGFADFLDDPFAGEVVVSLDAPQRAQEAAKGLAKSLPNFSFYRISPSGFHGEAGFQDPLSIRAHSLLTCFPASQGAPESVADLRVPGNAMALLQSAPTIPVVLPGPAPGGARLRIFAPVRPELPHPAGAANPDDGGDEPHLDDAGCRPRLSSVGWV